MESEPQPDTVGGSSPLIFVIFTDTHSKLYRWLGGLAHATAHWSGMFVIGWSAMLATRGLTPVWSLLRFFIAGILVVAGGWLVGSVLMGLYLLISLNVFGRQSRRRSCASNKTSNISSGSTSGPTARSPSTRFGSTGFRAAGESVTDTR